MVYAAVSLKQKMIFHLDAKLVGPAEEKVKKAMAAFKEVVVQKEGFIHDTIYEDMIGHQGFESVSDFHGLVGFDYRALPIRISTNFTENADFIVFTASGPQEITWYGFANGHVEKVQGAMNVHKRLGPINEKHSKLLRAAGYPDFWADRDARRKWMKENGHRLFWDAKLKLFKYQPNE